MAPGTGRIDLLREQLREAHGLLEATMKGVDVGMAHALPPGKALPVAAQYAHVVLSEDGGVNGMLKGGVPLFAGTFAGKTGASELPPGPDPKKPGFPDWSIWGRRVRIDLPAFRAYAKAVYEATDAYLAGLTDEDLARPLDLTILKLGTSTVGFVITNGLIGNAYTHAGEIACLKGIRGTRGYPV